MTLVDISWRLEDEKLVGDKCSICYLMPLVLAIFLKVEICNLFDFLMMFVFALI